MSLLADPISRRSAGQMGAGSLVRAMFEKGAALKAKIGADNVCDFALGNPSVEPPAALFQRVSQLALDPTPGMHRYMGNAGYDFARDAVASSINVRQQLAHPLTKMNILMTCGAAGALNVFLKSVLDPGDQVLVPAPYFVEYGFYVDNHDGVLKPVATKADFQLDLEAMEAGFNEKTRVVLINSPNNPTGVVYNETVLRQLNELITRMEQKYGRYIFLLADEPYVGLLYDGVKVPSVLSMFPHSAIATSHSKDLGIPAERIGHLALSPRIEEVGQLYASAVLNNRILGFVNAPALMQRAVAEFQGQVSGLEEYQMRRDVLYAALTAMGYDIVKPQGTFYMFPKSPNPNDMQFSDELYARNILVVPGKGFGLAGYFRISYAETGADVIERSLDGFSAMARQYELRG